MADATDYIIDFLPQDPSTRALIRGLKNFVTMGGGGGSSNILQASPAQAPVTLTAGETGRAGRAGFEKPVGAALRLRLNRLRRELKAASPKGKPRPRGYRVGGKFYTYRKPYIPGKLKSSWDNPATVQLAPSGKSIIIRNDLPYARAQDKGASIPTRYPKKGKFLMFPGGGKFFHKKAKGFRLRGQSYVQDAVQNWARKWGYEDNVRWAPYRGVRLTS